MRQNSIARFLQIFALVSGIIFLAARAVFAAVQYVPFDPPNEQRIKIELHYSQVDPVPNGGGKVRWKEVQIKQFPLTNSTSSGNPGVIGTNAEPLMIAETPECVSDNHLDEITSAASLKVHTQAGKMFLEGVGFFLSQTNSRLVVSNQVHSILQLRPPTNSPAGSATDITSHRGEFEMKNDATNGLALYIGDVHVADPEMKLNCEWLRAELPKGDTGQAKRPNHIVTETNVVIDFTSTNGEKIHAIGQRGIYDYLAAEKTNTEILELTGQPRIDLTNGWMTADLFIMDRVANKLRGSKNCHFHYQQQNQSTNASEINIASEEFEYDLNTRLANFSIGVRADDGTTKLSCEFLTAALPKSEPGKTNQLDHILALTNVVIDFVDAKTRAKTHATGQKAIYDYHVQGATTNAVLELTGNPSVELTNGWMTAEVIRVDRAQGHMWGEGGQHSVFHRTAGEPASMDTEIFSGSFEYTTATGIAIYREKVRAFDPQLNLTNADLLTVQLADGANGQTNRLKKIVAEGGVALDLAGKAFASGDITNLSTLAGRLNNPSAPDHIAQFVASQITPPTKKLLTKYNGGTNAPLQAALAEELDRLTLSAPLYDSNRFENVFLSVETIDLMHQHPIGLDLIQLNRSLLLDAFRGELARSPYGDKTHATADRAIYTNIGRTGNTNALLELYGHPSLSNSAGLATAENAIIYDTVTRRWHFEGKPQFHPNLERFAKTPEPAKKGTK